MLPDLVLDLIPIFFLIMFALFFVVLISTAVKASREKKNNDAALVQEVEAVVTGKRTRVSTAVGGRDLAGDDYRRGFHSRTTCYATLELLSGERLEFQVKDVDYGELVEGDRGTLSFQGTRFLRFQQERAAVARNKQE